MSDALCSELAILRVLSREKEDEIPKSNMRIFKPASNLRILKAASGVVEAPEMPSAFFSARRILIWARLGCPLVSSFCLRIGGDGVTVLLSLSLGSGDNDGC